MVTVFDHLSNWAGNHTGCINVLEASDLCGLAYHKKKKINDRYSSHYHKRYKNLFLRCVFQNLKGASFTVPNMPVSHSSKDIAFVSCGEIMNTFKMYNLNEGLKTKQ